MKRRSFLRLVGLGGAATALPLLSASSAVSPAVELARAVEATHAAEMQWLLKSIVVPIPFPEERRGDVAQWIDDAIRRDDANAREWLSASMFDNASEASAS